MATKLEETPSSSAMRACVQPACLRNSCSSEPSIEPVPISCIFRVFDVSAIPGPGPASLGGSRSPVRLETDCECHFSLFPLEPDGEDNEKEHCLSLRFVSEANPR